MLQNSCQSDKTVSIVQRLLPLVQEGMGALCATVPVRPGWWTTLPILAVARQAETLIAYGMYDTKSVSA
jgi:hypothetical protein